MKPDDDGTLSFNHYTDSTTFDIGKNTLSLLFAILELQFGLLRFVLTSSPFRSHRIELILSLW